ncbi:MAG: transporter substrate-binding protein [Frondihabitans sp.]|nr:transporter substrate-binding protein [Frondihabitans sp.]
MTTISRRQLLGFSLGGAATLVLAGCAVQPSSTAGASSSKPTFGGTLNVYEAVQFSSWQITNTLWSNSNVTPQLVDRLTWQDPKSGKIFPWLATKWTISADHLHYTFTLRDGVTFSDGTKVDAAAVKANYDQHGLGDKSRGIVPDSFFSNYVGAEVVDPLTVRISLSKPNAGFLQVTSIYRTGILAASTLAKNWNDQGQITNLIGSGPFVYASGDGVTTVTLKRREDYNWAPPSFAHSGKAYLDKVVYRAVTEESVRVGALSSAQAHIARGILPNDEATVTSAGGKILSFGVQGESNHLEISLAAPIVADKNVRLALQAATNRKEIRATALSPSYKEADGLLVHGTPDFVDGSSYLDYDLAKAKKLLTAAGWVTGSDGIRAKDGEKLAFTFFVAPFYPVSQTVLELLQSQWAKAGVQITIKSPSLTEYESEVGKSTAFQQAQWSRAEPDVLRTSFDSTQGDSTYTTIPELDTLVRAQAQQFDPAKRQEAIQAISDYVLSNALVIPLYDETQVFGVRSNVHGFQTEAVARGVLYNTWLS